MPKMKTKNIELDVDYIGEQEPLATVEEKAISDFFGRKKLNKSKKDILPIRRVKRSKEKV
jgi:hypothetical protein